jgi:hypothetical protein
MRRRRRSPNGEYGDPVRTATRAAGRVFDGDVEIRDATATYW